MLLHSEVSFLVKGLVSSKVQATRKLHIQYLVSGITLTNKLSLNNILDVKK